MNAAIKQALSVLLIALAWAPSFGRADLDPDQNKIESEALSIGGPRLVELVRYRARVERGAYRETLDLCAGYVIGQNRMGHHPPDFAWARVFGHGLAQPLSALGLGSRHGLKATYNDVNQIRIWHPDAWFRSVHVIYLVHSDGFKRAARECLGADQPERIKGFARAITGADVLGTLVSGEILAVPLNAGLRWVGGMVVPWWTRLVVKPLTRNMKLALISTVTPVVGYRSFVYLRDLRRARSAARDLLRNAGAEPDRVDQSHRRLLMAAAVGELRRALEVQNLSQFETWAKRKVTAELVRRCHRDLDDLRARTERGIDDENYRLVLKAILPVLDQIPLVEVDQSHPSKGPTTT